MWETDEEFAEMESDMFHFQIHVHQSQVESGAVEASTLEIKPGSWPSEIIVEETGQIFAHPKPTNRDGELMYFEYFDANGEPLTVLND